MIIQSIGNTGVSPEFSSEPGFSCFLTSPYTAHQPSTPPPQKSELQNNQTVITHQLKSPSMTSVGVKLKSVQCDLIHLTFPISYYMHNPFPIHSQIFLFFLKMVMLPRFCTYPFCLAYGYPERLFPRASFLNPQLQGPFSDALPIYIGQHPSI